MSTLGRAYRITEGAPMTLVGLVGANHRGIEAPAIVLLR